MKKLLLLSLFAMITSCVVVPVEECDIVELNYHCGYDDRTGYPIYCTDHETVCYY